MTHMYMINGNEMYSLISENKVELHQEEMRWMYGVKLRDEVSAIEFRQQLEIDDVLKVVQRYIL